VENFVKLDKKQTSNMDLIWKTLVV